VSYKKEHSFIFLAFLNRKGSCYEELEIVSDKFPKYGIMLLGDFNIKAVRERIFKRIPGSERLHGTSSDNEVTVVHFAISKNLIVKTTMFSHRNFDKYT
jgi:hypothetical protein